MTRAPLLGPARVRFCTDRSAAIGGAWYPYTIQLADELPDVLAAAREVLGGDVTRIDVNWQNFRRYPGLDSPDAPDTAPLMTLVGEHRSVTLLVIPPRTASSLAATLLRQASAREIPEGQKFSLEVRRAERILERAALSRESS